MLFNSFVFLLAFPIIFAAYYLCPIKWQQLASITDKLCSLYELGARIRIDPLVGNSDDLYRRSLYIPQQPQEQAKNDRRRNFDLAPLLFFKYYNFINNIVYDILTPLPPAHRNKYKHGPVPIGIPSFHFRHTDIWRTYITDGSTANATSGTMHCSFHFFRK